VSDREDPAVEPSFDDPAHDDLRALLADARVTDPIPDDVAARLDSTLQSLQIARAAERDSRTNVVPLRHRVGRVLVAAAAAVVIGAGGVGVAQLARNGNGSADSMTADKAARGSAQDDGRAPEATGQSDFLNAPGPAVARALPHLTTAGFARDAARVMRTAYLHSLEIQSPAPTTATTGRGSTNSDSVAPLSGYLPLQAPPVTATPERTAALAEDFASCAGPNAPDAIVEPATLDDALVALVFRPPTAESQQVEAWSCDGTTLLASAEIEH